MPGLSSPEKEELAAARRRIAQLETELAVTRRAAELLKEQAPPFDRVVRVIRDIFSPDFVELVVDGDDLYQRVEEYLTEVAPRPAPQAPPPPGRAAGVRALPGRGADPQGPGAQGVAAVGLLDSFSETCPTCDGRGVVITHEI